MLDEARVARLIRDFHESEIPSPIFSREVKLPLTIGIKRAITVIGPRRAGKSYLLFYTIKQLLEKGIDRKNILYLNFEDPTFEAATAADLANIPDIFFRIYPEKRNGRLWFFFDEVQEVAGWERFIRAVIDRFNASVFLTGSSSRLLSKEIATSMRGRTLSYLLLSLSFSEFLEFSGIESVRFPSSAQELTLSKMACEYLKFGGYPETVLYKRERERLLRELLDVAIQRDIIERYGIRNIKVLRMLIEAIATSSEFSMHRFFNFLKSNGYKVSKNTLYTYLQALEDAFIIHETKRYSKSVRQREQSMSKPYMLDNGLLMVNNVSGGKLFENAVFNALFRNEKLKIYYYSDQSSEVDFIVEEKGAVKALVQASSELNGIETKEREFKALYRASDALDCNKLIIVTLNSKGTEIYKGKKINIMPIWELMLAPVAQW